MAPAIANAQVNRTGLPTREEIDPSRRELPPPPSRLKIDGDIERSPCALSDPTYAAIKIKLTSATFNNLGDVAAAELEPAWRPYVGVESPIAVVCEIRDVAATILRRQGFLAAVQVPAQRIEGGNVRFEVLFAKLTAVRLRGDAGRDEAQVARYLSHLATGKVFNRLEAERYLLLARDLPGLDVRLSLKPAGTVPGEMIGEVSVRHTPIEADFNIQNYAPRETGRFGGQLRAQFNGLTGLGDRTTASFYTTADFKEQQVLQLGHDFAVGGNGLRLGGHFTYAWTHPTLGPTAATVKARSLFFNLEATYPIIRSQAFTLGSAIGFDYVNQNVRFAGLPLSEDHVRVGYARLDADAIDLNGVGPGGTIGWHLQGALELRQGLRIFGASPNCLANVALCTGAGFVPPGLVDGNPSATVLRFTGQAEARVSSKLSLAILPRAQISSAPLLSFEQFSAGSYTVGRGYDPGVFSGDSGAGFAAEVRYDRIAVLPRQNIAMQPYAFVDTAWVWNRNSPAGQDPQTVTSVGGGARLAWSNRARLDLSVAVPLRDAGTVRSGDVRVLMSLTTRFVPWRTR
jgi:hemolysin activation/secretion protein